MNRLDSTNGRYLTKRYISYNFVWWKLQSFPKWEKITTLPSFMLFITIHIYLKQHFCNLEKKTFYRLESQKIVAVFCYEQLMHLTTLTLVPKMVVFNICHISQWYKKHISLNNEPLIITRHSWISLNNHLIYHKNLPKFYVLHLS